MSPKTAHLKQTSEQRCREAFDKFWPPSILEDLSIQESVRRSTGWICWQACWKYLEERLLKEIQS